MRRGEIWRIKGALGRERLVVVVGSDSLIGFYPMTQVVPIFDAGTARDTLVTVSLPAEPVAGVVVAPGIYSVRRELGVEQVGTVPPDIMDTIDIAVRAVLDL